jgi:ribosome small subunit-dependent GTPase A
MPFNRSSLDYPVIRLGAISFVNTIPVYAGYSPEPGCQIVYNVPSQLNQMILSGELDVSPVSSICYLQHQDCFQLLENLSVSSYGSVESVLFLSRFPLGSDELKASTIAVSSDSETSIQLLNYCLNLNNPNPLPSQQLPSHFSWPLFRYPAQQYADMLDRYGNALIIGDLALAIRQENLQSERFNAYYQYDLSTLWQESTGLPFVFAVWVARKEWVKTHPEAFARLNHALVQSRAHFFSSDSALAEGIRLAQQQYPFSENTLRRYYTTSLDYNLSALHHQSLQLFASQLNDQLNNKASEKKECINSPPSCSLPSFSVPSASLTPALQEGRLIKYHSNYYYVDVAGVLLECFLRGVLKKEGSNGNKSSNHLCVGDWVVVEAIDPLAKTACITQVKPRKNSISRPKLANVDSVIVVHSIQQPTFDYTQVDRYLTLTELAGIQPILCISKTDLAEASDDTLAGIVQLYETQLGYPVFLTSSSNTGSVRVLYQHVQYQVSVLAGPSGSGKSSLLNTLNPELTLRVGNVSEKIQRGQHTTRHVELLSIEQAGNDELSEARKTLIADTPGFSHARFNTVLPAQLASIFRDFIPYRNQCYFSDCLHLNETGCAVLKNLEDLSTSRYQSYLAFMAEAKAYETEQLSSSKKQPSGYKIMAEKGKQTKRILRVSQKNREVSRSTARQQLSDETAWVEDNVEEN